MQTCETTVCLMPNSGSTTTISSPPSCADVSGGSSSIDELKRIYSRNGQRSYKLESRIKVGKVCLGTDSEIIAFINRRIDICAPAAQVESGIEGDDTTISLLIDFRTTDKYFEHIKFKACDRMVGNFLRVLTELKLHMHILMSEILPNCILERQDEFSHALAQNKYLKSLFIIDIQLRHAPKKAIFPLFCTILRHTKSVEKVQLIKEWALPSANNDIEMWTTSLEINSSIKALDMSHNSFTKPMLEHMSLLPQNSTNLRELRLLDCDIRDGELDSITRLIPKIMGLVELDLSWNGPFCPDGSSLSRFGAVLSDMPCLETLNLSHCNITGKEFTPFARYLPAVKFLKKLDLSDNYQIDSIALCNLNQAIEKSESLKTVVLGNCPFRSIEYSLKLNRFNAKKFVRDPPALAIWPTALEKMAADADVLFYCLGQISQLYKT